ncbi:S-layer homology domain-containing protein [Peptoniphilus stercorisuis]|uniref:SLH domain-containing protein n=1 Tax=Peptoniphilus stercorisuis TaxID=1436965 RepID=A0ABS4KE04_9FIRM|nr:S-layer homology domain-containing protein [Peptoniphilus stercorisuis]MBP2024874.1 hypothetical protein [Peptoniphilus stercorisuis]
MRGKDFNNKYVIIILLILLIGVFTSVRAIDSKADLNIGDIGKVENFEKNDDKIKYLRDKKIVIGYEDGDLKLDKPIRRSEMAQLLIKAFGKEDLAKELQDSLNPYADIEQSFWANGIIVVVTKVPSSQNGLYMLNGYPNRKFLPNRNLTYAELAKILVVLVKEDLTVDMANDADANWPKKWIKWANDYQICRGLEVDDSSKEVSRENEFIMFYNALLSRS